jgi:hypothetical protein
MRFMIPNVHLNSHGSSLSIDDENGKSVGQILFNKGSGRTIILLGKYRGTFESLKECEAFAKGVQTVLNHMTSTND